MDNQQEINKNWNLSNSVFSFNRQLKKSRASVTGHTSRSSGSSGYVGNQSTYPKSTKSGASESNSSGSSGYAGKKSSFHSGHYLKFGHIEINYYENGGYVGEPTAFPHSGNPRELGTLEELDKNWKNSDSAFSSTGSHSRQSSKSNLVEGSSNEGTMENGFGNRPSHSDYGSKTNLMEDFREGKSGFRDLQSSSGYGSKSNLSEGFCGSNRRYDDMPSSSGYGSITNAEGFCGGDIRFQNLPPDRGYSSKSNLAEGFCGGGFVNLPSNSCYGSKSNLAEGFCGGNNGFVNLLSNSAYGSKSNLAEGFCGGELVNLPSNSCYGLNSNPAADLCGGNSGFVNLPSTSGHGSNSNLAAGVCGGNSGFLYLPSTSYGSTPNKAADFYGRNSGYPSTFGYSLNPKLAADLCGGNSGFVNLQSTSGDGSKNVMANVVGDDDGAFLDLETYTECGLTTNLNEHNIGNSSGFIVLPPSDLSLNTHVAECLNCGNNTQFTSGFSELDTNQQNVNMGMEGLDLRRKSVDVSTSTTDDVVQLMITQNDAELTTPTPHTQTDVPMTEEPVNFLDSGPRTAMNMEQEAASENMEWKNTEEPNVASFTRAEQPPKDDAPPASAIKDLKEEGFSCVVSVRDGVVMHTMLSLTNALGFPHEMWIGRNFIDFVHPMDRSTFALQLTSGLTPSNNTGANVKNQASSIICRIRQCKTLASSGFAIRDQPIYYTPFQLKFFFRKVTEPDGSVIYLVIQATPQVSAYKTPNEKGDIKSSFVMRHSADGIIEYIDLESAPYLGYMPHEMVDKDVLQLYHPDDLQYIRRVYETIVTEGGLARTEPYRLLAQNGDYVKLETEWHSFINMWSRKLEFVVGKNYLLEGPTKIDVFAPEDDEPLCKIEDTPSHTLLRESIRTLMKNVSDKPINFKRHNMSLVCDSITTYLQRLTKDVPVKNVEKVQVPVLGPSLVPAPVPVQENKDQICNEMPSGSDPLHGKFSHDEFNNKSCSDVPLTYTNLNFNETLNRYFVSHEPFVNQFKAADANLNGITGKSNRKSKRNRKLPQFAPRTNCRRPSVDCPSNRRKESSPENCQPFRLTESLLNIHDVEMEKELVNKRRSCSKIQNDRLSSEIKHKEPTPNVESSHPTAQVFPSKSSPQRPGIKRSLSEDNLKSSKQMCVSPPGWKKPNDEMIHKDKDSFSGMVPLFYFTPVTSQTPNSNFLPTCRSLYPGNASPCVVFGKTMYPLPYLIEKNFAAERKKIFSTFKVHNKNFQACMFDSLTASMKPANGFSARANKASSRAKVERERELSFLSSSSTDSWQYQNGQARVETPKCEQTRQSNSGTIIYTEDEASSVSSFYAAFLRTTDSSAEEVEKNPRLNSNTFFNQHNVEPHYYNIQPESMIKKRRMNNWTTEKVEATRKPLIGYQIKPDDKEKVLAEDKNKLDTMKQTGEARVETPQCEQTRQSNSGTIIYTEDEASSVSSFYAAFLRTTDSSAEEVEKNPRLNSNTFFNHLNAEPHYYNIQPESMIKKRRMNNWTTEKVEATRKPLLGYQIKPDDKEKVLAEDKNKLDTLKQLVGLKHQVAQLRLDLQLQSLTSKLSLEEKKKHSVFGERATVAQKKHTCKQHDTTHSFIYEENVLVSETGGSEPMITNSSTSNPLPADVVPAEAVPADVVPADGVPTDNVPADVGPAEVLLSDVIPSDVAQSEVVPADA